MKLHVTTAIVSVVCTLTTYNLLEFLAGSQSHQPLQEVDAPPLLPRHIIAESIMIVDGEGEVMAYLGRGGEVHSSQQSGFKGMQTGGFDPVGFGGKEEVGLWLNTPWTEHRGGSGQRASAWISVSGTESKLSLVQPSESGKSPDVPVNYLRIHSSSESAGLWSATQSSRIQLTTAEAKDPVIAARVQRPRGEHWPFGYHQCVALGSVHESPNAEYGDFGIAVYASPLLADLERPDLDYIRIWADFLSSQVSAVFKHGKAGAQSMLPDR